MDKLANTICIAKANISLTPREKIAILKKVKENIYNSLYKNYSKEHPIQDFESHWKAHLLVQLECSEIDDVIEKIEKIYAKQ